MITSIDDQLLQLRFKPKRARYRYCSEPAAFDYFDWVVWSPDDNLFQRKKREYPSTILSLPTKQSLSELVERKHQIHAATLVIAGEDTHLSRVLDTVNELVPHCKKIFFEAKDVEHNSIRSFSMGSISYYIKQFEKTEFDLRRRQSANEFLNKHGILAAWGAIFRCLDDKIEDRINATAFVERTPWLQREFLSPDSYIKRLMETKYLLAPAGNGIQAPKLAEAWLMRTVPIVVKNPCFKDLSEEGFPFLMLDTWADLTKKLLNEYEETRLQIDWHNVEQMLTLEYFLARLS
jgi:hypothetical protein